MITVNEWNGWSHCCWRQLRKREHNLQMKDEWDNEDVDMVERLLRSIGCNSETAVPDAEQRLHDHRHDSLHHERAYVVFRRMSSEYVKVVMNQGAEHFSLMRSRQHAEYEDTWIEQVAIGSALTHELYQKYVMQLHTPLHRQWQRLSRMLKHKVTAEQARTEFAVKFEDSLPTCVVFKRYTDTVAQWLQQRLVNREKRAQVEQRNHEIRLHQLQPVEEQLQKLKEPIDPHRWSIADFYFRRQCTEEIIEWLDGLLLFIETNALDAVQQRLQSELNSLQSTYTVSRGVDAQTEKQIEDTMDQYVQRHFDHVLYDRLRGMIHLLESLLKRDPENSGLKQLNERLNGHCGDLLNGTQLFGSGMMDPITETIRSVLFTGFVQCSGRDLIRAQLSIVLELQSAAKQGSSSMMQRLRVKWRSGCVDVINHYRNIWSDSPTLQESEEFEAFLHHRYDTQQAVAVVAKQSCTKILNEYIDALDEYRVEVQDEVDKSSVASASVPELSMEGWRDFDLPPSWADSLPAQWPVVHCQTFFAVIDSIRQAHVARDTSAT